MKKITLLTVIFVSIVTDLYANIWVTPNPGYENDSFTFHVSYTKSLDNYKPKIRLYGLSNDIVREDFLDRQSATHYAKTYTIKYSGNGKFTIGLRNSKGQYQWTPFQYYTVRKRLPKITSISPSPLIAKDTYQNVYLYGENFKSSNVVEWQNGNASGTIKNGNGFHYISGSQIRLYIKTTRYGTGTWLFRIKDGNSYSDWFRVQAVSQNHNPTLYTVSNPPTQIKVGESATFKLKAYDSDGDLHLIEVDWNDGSGSEVASKQVTNNQVVTFSRRFTKPGTYTITATAYDRDVSFKSNTKSWTIRVVQASNHKPTLSTVQTLPSSIRTNQAATLKLQGYDQDGDLRRIEVDWNDGAPQEVQAQSASNYQTLSFSRTFTRAGTYTVTATAYDSRGNKSDMRRWSIVVKATNHNPTLYTISNPPTQITAGEYATFKLKAYDSDGDLHLIEVDWNDGSGSEVDSKQVTNNQVVTFSRRFTKPGTYTITATAYDRDTSFKSNTKSWTIRVVQASNHKPTLSTVQALPSSIRTNQTATLKLQGYDQDGDLRRIEVDWNDGAPQEVQAQSASNYQTLSFSRTFTRAGTYTVTATAYDSRGNKSDTVRINIDVLDENYRKKPYVSHVVIAGYKSFLEANKGEYLYIYGNNFSKKSDILLKNATDGRTYTIYADDTFGTNKPVIREKSATMLGVNVKFGNSDIGRWRVIVRNGNNFSNDNITVEVKKGNQAPIVKNIGISKTSIISGTHIQVSFNAVDSDLDRVCYQYRGETKCKQVASGTKATFDIVPTTSKKKESQSIRLFAVDKRGVYSQSQYINLIVYNGNKYEYTFINNENVSKAGVCGGKYVIREKHSINTATGAEMFSLPLLKVEGLHTISAILSYNSLLLTNNHIYKGWNLNYDIAAYLEFRDNGDIRLHWNTGNFNDFYPTTQNPSVYKSNDTVTKFAKLEHKNNGTYVVELPNQSKYIFYANGRLERVENYLGQSIQIDFDTKGWLSGVKDIQSGVYLEYHYDDQGKLNKIIDPQLGREATLSYNAKGQLTKIELPENISYRFEYNDLDQISTFTYGDGTRYFQNHYRQNGRIETEDDGRDDNRLFRYSFDTASRPGKVVSTFTDGEGKTTTYLYDAKDFLLYKVIDAKGNTLVNRYDPNSRLLISTTNELNQTTRYKYDDKGNLIEISYPNGLKKQMKYDERKNLLEETFVLKEGKRMSTAYTYGSHNELLSKRLPNGNTYRYKYNQNKQLIEKTTPSGAKTTYSYEKGRLSKVTYPNGGSVSYRYDAAGRLIEETKEPLGATTTYQYDDADRLIAVTDPMGNTIRYGYDMRGNKIYTIDAKGYMTKYLYDGNNNLIKTIYPDGTETTYEYDGEDRIKTITYANGATNKFEYDALGRVTKQIDAMGNFVAFTYDALGNVLQKTDRDGNIIAKYKYDAMQKVVEAVDYFNNKTTNQYNQLELLEQTTDPLGRVSKFKYDKLGRLTEAIDALNGISKQSFDADGNRKSFTDPNNNTTELKHDKVGNLTEIKTASGSTTKYVYDANGLLIKEINGRGQERTYTYNKNGQVATVKDKVGTITYEYDANGNPTSIDENGKKITFVYDEMNRLSSYTDTMGNTIRYEYDSVGNLKTLIYPDGKRVSYDYNKANQLIKVKDWNNHTTTYEYDSHGRLIKRTYPNGAVLTRTYDKGGRLTSQKEYLGQNKRISEYAYVYDKVGNIIKERVYPTISPKALASLQMSYAKGNLLNEANQSKATFDADDNMLSWGDLKLTYDSRNRLIKANGISYAYDVQNHRIATTINGKTTHYITNPNASLSQLLVKTDPDGSQTYYVYGLGLISQTKGNETLYYHYDLRGSTIALSDQNGNITDRFAYTPYGKLINHTGAHTTPFLFVGKHGVMKEANNLYYMRARYYHDTLRRFVNRDTLLGEVGDFGSLNRFGYVEGNPLVRIDPNGHFIQFIVAAVVIIGAEMYAAEPVYAPSNEDVKTGELFRKGQEDYERRRAIADIAEFGLGIGGIAKGVCKAGIKSFIKTSEKEFEKAEINYITRREFKGRLTIQNDTLIDKNFIDNQGRNFIERMEEGLAPIGKDGKSIEIHHSRQEDKVWIEMLSETHKKNNKILHSFKKNSIIDHQKFNNLRNEYWKERALDFSDDF